MEPIQPFAISLLIGLLIGIERERAHAPGEQALGLRTFVLLSLLGCLAGYFKHAVFLAGILFFVVGGILLGYWRSMKTSKRQDAQLGFTTEAAGLVVFALGYLANTRMDLAFAIGSIVLFLLASKQRLHRLASVHLKHNEVEAAAIILLIGLAIMPFLPSQAIDPWNVFIPQKFFALLIALSLVQVLGYIASRLCGPSLGMIAVGFFSGFVSSTSFVLHACSEAKRHHILSSALTSSILLAVSSKLILFYILIGATSTNLLIQWLVPIGTMVLFASFLAFVFSRHQTKVPAGVAQQSPLHLVEVIKLAAILFLTLAIIALIREYLGDEMVATAAFLGGLLELHGVSLALATLTSQNIMSLDQTILALSLALSASFISKIVILILRAPNYFRWRVITSLVVVLLLGMISLWLTVQFKTVS